MSYVLDNFAYLFDVSYEDRSYRELHLKDFNIYQRNMSDETTLDFKIEIDEFDLNDESVFPKTLRLTFKGVVEPDFFVTNRTISTVTIEPLY